MRRKLRSRSDAPFSRLDPFCLGRGAYRRPGDALWKPQMILVVWLASCSRLDPLHSVQGEEILPETGVDVLQGVGVVVGVVLGVQ